MMHVLAPTSLEAACAMLTKSQAAIPIAGATDLLVHWPTNLPAHDKTYLDLSRLTPLRAHRWTSTHLELGALTTYWDIITDQRCTRDLPLLVKAAPVRTAAVVEPGRNARVDGRGCVEQRGSGRLRRLAA